MGVYEVQKKRELWSYCPLPDIDPVEVDTVLRESNMLHRRLDRELAGKKLATKALDYMRKDLRWLQDQQPLIESVCNHALRLHHWDEIKIILNIHN